MILIQAGAKNAYALLIRPFNRSILPRKFSPFGYTTDTLQPDIPYGWQYFCENRKRTRAQACGVPNLAILFLHLAPTRSHQQDTTFSGRGRKGGKMTNLWDMYLFANPNFYVKFKSLF